MLSKRIKFAIKNAGFTLACDGKAALEKAIDPNLNWRSPKQKHSDLLSAISKTLKSNELKIISQHVKGHQDDVLPFDMLCRPAQLNVICDFNAKAELTKVLKETEDNTACPHPLSFPTIKYNGTIIRENTANTLYQSIADDLLEEAWIESGRYSQPTSSTIDWDIQCKALKAAPLKTKRFVCKWVSNTISTGANMVKWKL